MFDSTLHKGIKSLMVLSLCAGLAAGCGEGDDPTGNGNGNGETGSVQAAMTDGGSSNAVVSGDRQAALLSSATFSGSMTSTAHVEIYSETRGWVQLGSPNRVTMQMQSGSETTVHASSQAEADTYTRVRLVLDDADATIEAGSVIGSVTLDGNVQIRVGGSDGRVTIEKSVSSFTVSANSSTRLVFDLNSEAWVDSQSAESETASDAEVQSATTVIVQ